MGKRPISITVIAWFLIVGGVIMLITSSATLNNPMVKEIMARTPVPISVQYAMTYINILVGVAAGIGMLKKQNWARFLYVIWGAIQLLYVLFTSPMKMAFILSLLSLAIIVFFLFRPVANRYFSKA